MTLKILTPEAECSTLFSKMGGINCACCSTYDKNSEKKKITLNKQVKLRNTYDIK